VGGSRPLFTIAEIGLNHGGSVERALALVDAAASAGVSAIKLQVLTARELVGPSSVAPAHVNVPSLQAFFATFELSEADYRTVVARARARGLGVIATPLSLAAVDMLERVGIDAFKIASGDITWDQLLHRAAATKKPLVISTGMASLSEVAHALAVARIGGAGGVALLHCTSAYPVPRGDENLRAIAAMRTAFGVPVGLSDHGADFFAVPIAVALGASLYERHIVLDAQDGSIDAPVSSTPDGFQAIVALAARTQLALGRGVKVCGEAEAGNLVASRRSLCAVRPLVAGHVVEPGDLIALRPATGVAPVWEPALIGTRLRRDVAAGSPFLETDLESRMAHEVA
jgi:sialic acid synthase SpsE